MDTDADGLVPLGSTAEHLKRLEQQQAEFKEALAQLDEEISRAEQKSKYIIRDIVPFVRET